MFISSRHLFGLPERPDLFRLRTTDNSDPYRLYTLDTFPRENFNKNPLYSSMPYLIGHNSNDRMDAGILWLTGSETWVDIYNDDIDTRLNRNI